MCGIIGILWQNGAPPAIREENIAQMAHRGPDGSGLYQDSHVSFGHVRLAVLDFSTQAAQPLRSHDGRFVIVHNGAIYNCLELRKELEASGAMFRSRSGTEVATEAYRRWGKDCVRKFRGMFAFALWDTEEKTLFLARDRCGEVPLVYFRDGNILVFASEIRALLPLLPSRPRLNPAAVDMYLHYQYTPEPFTLLEGVHKFPAGHTLILSPDAWETMPERYWNVEDTPDIIGLPTDTPGILRCIAEALEESVKLTLRVDVPVAVPLSGGIDSGAIAAYAQKNSPAPLHAFSVGYPGRPPYDEREQAKALAARLGMIFHEIELPVGDFVDFFPTLVRLMDEPVADPAAFAHYALPKAAREMGIKVLLSGIGGDELFWGYDWVAKSVTRNQVGPAFPSALAKMLRLEYAVPYLYRAGQSKRLPALLRILAEDMQTAACAPPDGFLQFYGAIPDFAYATVSAAAFYGLAMRDLPEHNAYVPMNIGRRGREEIPAAVVRLLFDTWLTGNCLSLADIVSMASSVETRSPFLDPVFIELIMALRRRVPDHALGQKAWLRAALKGTLPEEVLVRPKSGFQPPVRAWLIGTLERYRYIFAHSELEQAGILLPQGALRMRRDSVENLPYHKLFYRYKLLLLEMWVQLMRKDPEADCQLSM